MNTKYFSKLFRFFLLITIVSFFNISSPIFSKNLEEIHIQKNPITGEEYKFRNVPKNLPLIKAFTIQDLVKDSCIKSAEFVEHRYGDHLLIEFDYGEGKIGKVKLYYWIYKSVSDAEFSMVDYFGLLSLGFTNAIDINKYEIGDNCWYNTKILEYTPMTFLRNNVRVLLGFDRDSNPNAVLIFAKKVDEAIINAEKVSDVKFIPAPIINSIEIIPAYPIVGEEVTLHIDAIDPNNLDLKFFRYGWPIGCNFPDGIIKIYRSNVDEAGLHEFYFWVMNEDRIVTLAKKEISF